MGPRLREGDEGRTLANRPYTPALKQAGVLQRYVHTVWKEECAEIEISSCGINIEKHGTLLIGC
jgi:hypothetical protein